MDFRIVTISNIEGIKRLIENHNRRLQKLKEQKALFGISADPKIDIEIEDIEEETKKLQAKLFELEEQPELTTSSGEISFNQTTEDQNSLLVEVTISDEIEGTQETPELLAKQYPLLARVLDEIAKIIPNGIYIIELEKQGNTLQLTGKSESNNHLANMIRAVELSDLFVGATPESITADDGSPKLLSSFKMKVKIKGLVDDAKKGGK